MKKIITAIAIAAASLSAHAGTQNEPFRMTLSQFERLKKAADNEFFALGYFFSVWETRPSCETDVSVKTVWTFVQADMIIRDQSTDPDAFTFMRKSMIAAMKCKPGTMLVNGKLQ